MDRDQAPSRNVERTDVAGRSLKIASDTTSPCKRDLHETTSTEDLPFLAGDLSLFRRGVHLRGWRGPRKGARPLLPTACEPDELGVKSTFSRPRDPRGYFPCLRKVNSPASQDTVSVRGGRHKGSPRPVWRRWPGRPAVKSRPSSTTRLRSRFATRSPSPMRSPPRSTTSWAGSTTRDRSTRWRPS